jgi:hypothetical protein
MLTVVVGQVQRSLCRVSDGCRRTMLDALICLSWSGRAKSGALLGRRPRAIGDLMPRATEHCLAPHR